jgi:hypothetical protein
VGNVDELEKIVLQDKLPGMVINNIESLGHEEQELLQKGLPRTYFPTCIIFEAERKPSGLGYVSAIVGGGVSLFAVGFLLIAKGFSQS